MCDLLVRKPVSSFRRKLLVAKLASTIVLASFALTTQAGKIISIPSSSGADGFGGLNLDNVEVVLDGTQGTPGDTDSWFDPSDGSYNFADDSDFTYLGNVDDGLGAVMGYTLAKDWPVGEPSGIKIVNDDFDRQGRKADQLYHVNFISRRSFSGFSGPDTGPM